MKKTVKVTFENGDYFHTEINGTIKQIEAYYVGKVFNLGDSFGDKLLTAVEVVICQPEEREEEICKATETN